MAVARSVLLAVVAGLVLVSSGWAAQVPGAKIPIRARVAYAVKFVCGPATEVHQEGLVKGVYRTAVNIHNPSSKPILFDQAVVRALPDQQPGAAAPFKRGIARPGQAIEVECAEIRRQLPLPMTTQLRTGFVVIRSERELDVRAVFTARPMPDGVPSQDIKIIQGRKLECKPGFGGPGCSIRCRNGPRCDAKVFYHDDGTVNGISARGTVLYPVTDSNDDDEILHGFKAWVLEHTSLLGLAPIAQVDVLSELVADALPARAHGPLVTHRYRQSYRGLPLLGPEAVITVTVAPTRGAIGFAGTVLDPRETLAGIDAPIAEQLARESIEQWFLERAGPGQPTSPLEITNFGLVAVPQRDTMGYAGDVRVAGRLSAHVIVSAAEAGGTRAPLVFFARSMSKDLADQQPITVRAERFTADMFDTGVTGEFSTLLDNAPLVGSVYAPSACDADPNAPGCGEPRLGNSEVVVIDAQGQPISGEQADPRVPTDPNGEFLAAPGAADYIPQNLFHKLLNAFHHLQPFKLGQWDSFNDGIGNRPSSAFDPDDYVPRLLLVPNVASPCEGALGCAGIGIDALGPGFDMPPHRPAGGGAAEPYGLIELAVPRVNVLFHEFGHTLDAYTFARVLGADVTESGDLECTPGTPDEAPPLAETVANMLAMYLLDQLYEAVEYDQPCDTIDRLIGRSTGVVAHSAACVTSTEQIRQFEDDRPGAADEGFGGIGGGSSEEPTDDETGLCNATPGYEVTSVFQPWWAFLHGLNCSPEAPFDCAPFPVPNTTPDAAGLRALLYALDQSNAQSYEMLFEQMFVRLSCDQGEAVGATFRKTFCQHGVIDCEGGPPMICPPACGNNLIEAGEDCEGENLAGESCVTLGFLEGDLACRPSDCTFDTSACVAEPTPPDDCIPGAEGCVCADVVGQLGQEDGHPDGDHDVHQFCPDDGDIERTCVAEGSFGVCTTCSGGNDRHVGCSCTEDNQCAADLTCWGEETQNGNGTGHCYDEQDGPPSWICIADCQTLFNSALAVCYNKHISGEARCLDGLCGAPNEEMCWTDGQLGDDPPSTGPVCRDNACVPECGPGADPENETMDVTCESVGYPAIYECDLQQFGGACRRGPL